LRSLWNDKTLDPDDDSVDERGLPNAVDSTDPHALSEVLSGALYRMMVHLHEECWDRYGGDFSSSGRALAEATGQFQRHIFRTIDSLPPGEVSFADYARVLASGDMTSFTTWGSASHVLAEELQRRHIIGGPDEVLREGPDARPEMEFDTLLTNDAEVRRFVNRHRPLFNIPPRVPITILPRLRTGQHSGWGQWAGTDVAYNVVLKVLWQQIEEDAFDRSFPTARSITCGTTIVFTTQGYVTDISTAEVDDQRVERDRMVRSLLESGMLQVAKRGGAGPQASPLRVTTRKGVMKISGAGRLLHSPLRPAD